MLGVQVQGGTGAGRRVVKQSQPWRCGCVGPDFFKLGPQNDAYRLHPAGRYSCPDCGARRP